MSFSLANYSKSTPTVWQVIGDISLVLIPVIMGIIEESPLEADLKSSIVFWMASALAIIKVLTQFFSDEVVEESEE